MSGWVARKGAKGKDRGAGCVDASLVYLTASRHATQVLLGKHAVAHCVPPLPGKQRHRSVFWKR